MSNPLNIYSLMEAARVPQSVKPETFGPWTIKRISMDEIPEGRKRSEFLITVGFMNYTLLYHTSEAVMHISELGEVVMEDSVQELRRHLPIWLTARGRVLVTGMGLGCVIRGLQANPRVEHITVVEIDQRILDRIGPEFSADARIRLIHGDARTVDLGQEKFDYAWHDLWTEGKVSLQVIHAELMAKFKHNATRQGAWGLPRFMRRLLPEWLVR
jgi:hypothetical protein